jgi:hypothetical protein
MNLPVPYFLTACGAVDFPSSTVMHAVCCLLYVLVRRTAYRLCVVLCCVVLCTGLCCVVYRFVLCCVPVCVVLCTGLCCVVYRFVLCCVVYRFVFTHCWPTALTVLRTTRWYRYKLCVNSPYNCKCRPPHYKIFRVFCEVEHTHAQTDDVPCQLNRLFAHDTVLKLRQVF